MGIIDTWRKAIGDVLRIGSRCSRRAQNSISVESIPLGTAEQRPEQTFPACKPYTRWWWLVGPFSDGAIIYQLDWLKEKGFGGVEIAWLWPTWLSTEQEQAPGIAWLSKEWTERMQFTKEHADHLGLGCDFTFGSCWPFGGAGVSRDDAAQTLDGLSRHRLELSWEAPSDDASSLEDGEPLWILNHLKASALDRYAQRMLQALSPALLGSTSSLFCDSLELDSERLWTSELWEGFRERYGYRLRDYAGELHRHADVRYDYRSLVADTMLEAFFRAYTNICQAAGARSRVQCHGSPTDLLAAYGAVDIPESEAILFPTRFSRIAASAAAIEGKPLVSCETFTCLYGAYHCDHFRGVQFIEREQVTDLKLLADAVLSEGVNFIIWHGMPFNGPNAKNRFFASVHVGPDAAFEGALKDFNHYLQAVSYLMRQGETYSRMAVYLPLEDQWMLDRLPGNLRTPGGVWHWEMRYATMPQETMGYHPLWVSKHYLREAEVNNGRLIVGQTNFEALLVDVEWLDADALREMLRLAHSGLRVVLRRIPKQPGRVKKADYLCKVQQLQKLSVASNVAELLRPSPLVSGNHIPPFFVRRLQNSLLFFFAHPATASLRYPLSYGQSRTMEEVVLKIVVHHSGRHHRLHLYYRPYQSLAVVVPDVGEPTFLDINCQVPSPVVDDPTLPNANAPVK